YVALGAVVVVLAGGVRRGQLTVGEMVSFLTLVALAAAPAQLLPAAYAMYRQARAAALRVEALVGGAGSGREAGSAAAADPAPRGRPPGAAGRGRGPAAREGAGGRGARRPPTRPRAAGGPPPAARCAAPRPASPRTGRCRRAWPSSCRAAASSS